MILPWQQRKLKTLNTAFDMLGRLHNGAVIQFGLAVVVLFFMLGVFILDGKGSTIEVDKSGAMILVAGLLVMPVYMSFMLSTILRIKPFADEIVEQAHLEKYRARTIWAEYALDSFASDSTAALIGLAIEAIAAPETVPQTEEYKEVLCNGLNYIACEVRNYQMRVGAFEGVHKDVEEETADATTVD